MSKFRIRWFHHKKVEAIHHEQGGATHSMEEATKAVQLETDSSWLNESPYKVELELLRMGNDLR